MSETAPDVPSTTASPASSPSRFHGFGGRALVVLGLSGLAVAQPVLDIFGRNPEFFVAGNYSSSQIVLFALVGRKRLVLSPEEEYALSGGTHGDPQAEGYDAMETEVFDDKP